ncbi:unnamed protein product [Chondrus crispus]|uniref:Uncharacterized protein n=1 Tax=Chondrus crispus TaxID=2769 RepID=R7QIE1_CHOCR|nr:unnamed protein product [Chondrus crispus]CDF38292.1 unnamed protein product [Chondrus crispus]|eukprot:XP_005718177.1 unnamed protein product [Chondrus crispus]
MVVSEKGCRAVYSATKVSRGSKGRPIEASVYRESYSGRIAAVYSNDSTRFGAHHYCLIPKDGFRHKFDCDAEERLQLIFDNRRASAECEEEGYNLPNASVTQRALSNSAVLKVLQLLGHLLQFTILQSEDPGWFLGRAFKFTSRTSNNFIGAIARNYICNIAGLSFLLRGKRLRAGFEPLTSDLKNLEKDLLEKWTSLSTTIGISSREMEQPLTHSEAEIFMSETASSLAQRRKDELLSLSALLGRKT